MFDSATPWTAAHQTSLSITNSWSLLKLMSIKSVMPSKHLILHHPLLLLPSILPSIRVFYNESVLCIRCPKYWSFSFSIRPSNEYSGLISFRMDWLDLLVVQGTLKSLLQHYSSKASILRGSGFLIVQFSHTYMTTGKTISLTRWTFYPNLPLINFRDAVVSSWSSCFHQSCVHSLGFCYRENKFKKNEFKMFAVYLDFRKQIQHITCNYINNANINFFLKKQTFPALLL